MPTSWHQAACHPSTWQTPRLLLLRPTKHALGDRLARGWEEVFCFISRTWSQLDSAILFCLCLVSITKAMSWNELRTRKAINDPFYCIQWKLRAFSGQIKRHFAPFILPNACTKLFDLYRAFSFPYVTDPVNIIPMVKGLVVISSLVEPRRRAANFRG